ncbi:GNAT family N-acetyltransferase [Pseudochelatococcus contaminans]|uniref:Putative N-acetyltransferase YhbS n=1 Tax=Pseudochelatococcus contaminans TaxID=1538103 RepID=A0A7W5Z3G4_9HYPH|nr:N-acetyltransferase [Pseudochelatococcus contaminans]MBB3809294.1 putative N-acetyltransferase YhbS [Pseudochelatococcus contaminans]
MFIIRDEIAADVVAREALLDACFGDSRFSKTSERLREGRLPASGLALSAISMEDSKLHSKLLGTVRLWHVLAGTRHSALLLGPLAVDPACQSMGLGGALMRHAIGTARALGHDAILLVGDAGYYTRFGFSPAATGALWMPGPFERERFLALELTANALSGARGMIAPAGEFADAAPALPMAQAA